MGNPDVTIKLETTAEQRFVTLAKKLEAQVDVLNEIREELNKVMTELGVNKYAQDPDTLAVYKTIKPTGTFTYYRDIDYKRTKLEGESAGGTVLSKKEAEEAGFTLAKS